MIQNCVSQILIKLTEIKLSFIENSTYMCSQNNQREIKKKFPSVIEEQIYVVQLNVVVIELPF